MSFACHKEHSIDFAQSIIAWIALVLLRTLTQSEVGIAYLFEALFSSARSRDFDGLIGIELPVSMYTTKTPIDLCRFNVRSST
jgi:energy-coupling factor transporter transmembrane protein EcfT